MSGRSFTPRYGVKTTATIHEAIKENPTIQKMFPAYSTAVERAKPTGRNPITVTRVPASTGAAAWPQGDDERSQCDSIKNPIRDHHDHKYRAQGQRDRRHHHDSHSPSQA